jgi:membrane-associated phospholipid phosphatase
MDARILLRINEWSSPWLDQLMLFVTNLGGYLFVLFATFIITAFLIRTKRWHRAILVTVGVGGAAAITSILKLIFARDRPELWQVLEYESTYSFPSGHATLSFALALCIVLLLWHTKWRWYIASVALTYIAIIGFSRLYLGVHYPTDILAGWIVAGIWVVTTWRVLQFLEAKKQGSKKGEDIDLS